LLASTGAENDLVVWDLSAGKEKMVLERLEKPVTFLAFHPESRLLAAGAGGAEGLVRFWNVESGAEVIDYLAGSNPQHGAISPDGRLLTVGNNSGETRLWRLANGARLGSWHSGAEAFSPDSKLIACGTNHTVEFRDAAGKLREHSQEYAPAIQCVAAHAGKQFLAWGARDGTIRLLTPADREPRSTKSRHERVEQLLFSPDGRLLASWGGDHRVRVWNTESGQVVAEPTYQGVRWFAFQSDRRALLAWTQQGGLRRWDLTAGRDLGEVRAPLAGVRSLALAAEGGTLALGGGDGSIVLLDLASAAVRQTLTDSAGRAVAALLFRPDGKALISSNLSGQGSKRWDLVKNKEQPLKEEALYSCAAFSPSGVLLAIGHADGAIRVWDPAAGERQATLRIGPSNGRVVQLAFLDERNLVSVNSNGTLYLLRLPGRDR
jgi:WD40 repeat protein